MPPLPGVIPAAFSRIESGVYVAAFEKPGWQPRGRVGSYLPTRATLAEEIQVQARRLAEAFPFRKEDLPFLAYEILLTGPPFFLAELSELKETAGLLVRTSKGRHGVSLPGAVLRSPAERFAEACGQAGIDSHTDDFRAYAFSIDVLREGSPTTL